VRAGPSHAFNPITAAGYPSPAPRPACSVLDSGKFERTFRLMPSPLRESLVNCLKRLLV
jgi:dTDP-4-dehydrorhamnose reductase